MLPSEKLNEPIILLSFHPALLILVNCGKKQYTSSSLLPTSDSLSLLSQSFAKFFSDKIHKLHTNLLINRTFASPHFPPPFTPPKVSSFTFVTTDEVSKLLSQSPETNCDLDPIPTFLLKQCSHILLPTITNIINLSFSTGIFPHQFKNCSLYHRPSF